MLGCLCLTGCLAGAFQGSIATMTPIPIPITEYPVVPVIDYPDVYINRYGFGFNLAEGWKAERHEEEINIILRKDRYALFVGYRWDTQPTPMHREPISSDLAEETGSLILHSFWQGEIPVTKYRLVEDNRVMMVYYSDEIAIDSLRLTIFLREETPDDDNPQGIPPAIEAEADTIVASYEEHGWEE